MDTRVTFVNHSYDLGRTEVVLFQQDRLAEHESPIAWKIIRRCGYECTHPFLFGTALQLAIFDPWGNVLDEPTLSPSSHVEISQDVLGRTMIHQEIAGHGGISVANDFREGAVSVFLARNRRAITPWRVLNPGTSALFDVGPELRVLPWSGLQEGDALPPEATSGPRAFEIFDLRGLKEVQLLMMGGGWGASAQHMRFALYKPVYGPHAY